MPGWFAAQGSNLTVFQESGDGHLRAMVMAELTVQLVLAVLMLSSEPAAQTKQVRQQVLEVS